VGQEKNNSAPTPSGFELIETVDRLAAFARSARQAEMVAVDLEADSMYHYREKVCLLQMAANGHTVVVDPLKVDDLSDLHPLFSDERICKVFHGADYDVRSLYRDFGISINNLFDTQLASMYMGHTETSLESVVAHRFGVSLDKRFQKKDWSCRPLPPDMVAYAASDVIYLIPMAQALQEELDAKGRLGWVQENCRMLSQVRHQENDQPMFLKIRGAGRLTPRQLAALEELLQLRDRLACQKDRPLFKVINNAALLKIAATLPTDLDRLSASQALSAKQVNMYGHAILAAVEKARCMPTDQLPAYPHQKSPRRSPLIPRRVNALRAWRDPLAAELGLDPPLLLNKALIYEIAARKPKSIEDLHQIESMQQWQVDAFGRQLWTIISSVT
jgi:ribonuclease D